MTSNTPTEQISVLATGSSIGFDYLIARAPASQGHRVYATRFHRMRSRDIVALQERLLEWHQQ